MRRHLRRGLRVAAKALIGAVIAATGLMVAAMCLYGLLALANWIAGPTPWGLALFLMLLIAVVGAAMGATYPD